MASTTTTIQIQRQNAEIFRGDAICKNKILELLQELCLPLGLLPLDNVMELGHNRETGFMWVVQRKKTDHTFKKIKQLVSYAAEMTGFVETGRMTKLTGVKTREFLFWLTITDVFVDDTLPGEITFVTNAGLSDSFPVSAFELGE